MIKLLKTSPLLLPLFLFSCSSPHVIEKESSAVANTAKEQLVQTKFKSSDQAAQANAEKPSNTENFINPSCAIGKVTLTADFAAARMDECKKVAENEFEIILVPENTPINSSPWYAFKVQAEQNTDIKITMRVSGDEHRYPPKISRDGKTWQLQEYKLRGKRLIMEMTASAKPVTIAAQEIINNEYYVDWAKQITKENTFTHSILGQSTQGRPIYKIESRNKNANEWVVILGRQHPPEVTGALALFPFVETLLSSSELSNYFLRKYNVLVIPNINPDGVEAGNWRSNANGFDLNRDWVDFTQVETSLINDYLQQLVSQGQKIRFAVDFHSTKSDIFYTMPVDYGVEKAYFVINWLGELDRQMPNFDVVLRPGNNPDLGVSKQYFSDKFGVHAITYEMGDNTDRTKIKRIAFKSANILMINMLSNVDHDKQ
ncbi:M14 family metallopeptidase [Colwellia psychrerythraea]|uniref:Peptidase M14 carboxypeptidase A n=1 Tax=Colwellia psychrerythraea TaxID=28229 RepID=A0A099KYU6_COLPS|nr:M14 family metallopeptidase [Colwellia psychrerythraea]KGJ95919.1 peptidase M14 carboxypeptidase A [Colwellia psychrerythraea]